MESRSTEHTTLIPVFSNEAGLIYGFQFALQLDGAELVDVLPGSVDLETENYVITDPTRVAFSWNSEQGAVSDISMPIYYLSVKDYNASKFKLSLMKDLPKAEMYLGEQLHTKVPSLSLYNDNGKSQFILYQNEPNPFKEVTEIKFYLPEKQDITLSFYGPDGTKIYSILDELDEGEHSYKVSADQFEGASVVYYQLSSELFNASNKMIIVR